MPTIIAIALIVACNALQVVSFHSNNYYNRFSPKFESTQRSETTSSASHLEVVVPNIGDTVSSPLNITAVSTDKDPTTIDHKSTLVGLIKHENVDREEDNLPQPKIGRAHV